MLSIRRVAAVFLVAGLCGASTALPSPSAVAAPAPCPADPFLPGKGGFVPITPFRLVDTRVPPSNDGPVYGAPTLSAGETAHFQVFDPTDPCLPTWGIAAVALNVTAVKPLGSGFLTVWPGDRAQPTASVLNYSSGRVVPNAVNVGLGPDLDFNVYTKGEADVVVDVMGVFASTAGGAGAGGFQSLAPERVLDTRPDSKVGNVVTTAASDGRSIYAGLRVTGGTVPADATAVVLNVTAVPGRVTNSPGYVAALPSGAIRPLVSNLNYGPTNPVANQVTVKLGLDGGVDFLVKSPVDIVADIMGYYQGGGPTISGGFVPMSPTRVTDTRENFGAVDVPARDSRLLTLAGPWVPVDAYAVSLNVAAVGAAAPGFVTVWPDSIDRPTASNVNFDANEIVANAVTVGLGQIGGVELHSNVTRDDVIDLNGWYTSPLAPA